MVRIDSLPDLSRFVRRGDSIRVHNTVHLLVGEDSVEVSGPVISQVSTVLQEMVVGHSELYLDQFTGEIEGIQDVVEMLYGGEMPLTEKNFRTVFKFSVIYKVDAMYALCLQWLLDNVGKLDVFRLIKFGLLIERIDAGNRDVLELCVTVIKEEGFGDDLVTERVIDDSLIKFLIQGDILEHTLPLITSRLSTDAHVNTVLTELEDKTLVETLWKHGAKSSDMFEKMGEEVTLLETSKRLNKFRDRNYRSCLENRGATASASSAMVEEKNDIVKLLSQDYLSFPIDNMVGVLKEYTLDQFQIVEVIFKWLCSFDWNSQNAYFQKLWGCVQQHQLTAMYQDHVYNTVTRRTLSFQWSRDNLIVKGLISCKYVHGEVTLAGVYIRSVIQVPTSFTPSKRCCKCHGTMGLEIKLVEKSPCFEVVESSHHVLKHAYFSINGCLYAEPSLYSLVTNSYEEVVEQITWSLNNRLKEPAKGDIKLQFIYECNE